MRISRVARARGPLLWTLYLAASLLACTDARSSRAREQVMWTEPYTGMGFLRVEPGTFRMGSPADEPGRDPRERPHEVRLTGAFWLGKFEVTQRQWQVVMGVNPSRFSQGGGSRPVESVTWHDIQDFLVRLNAQSPGRRFRLPTEAEWEYACRAGTHTPFATGPTLTHADANFAMTPERAASGEGGTTNVGAFPQNPWGFHDMHGNVWEWTDDDDCPYTDDGAVDPRSTCDAPLKVIRGGSWYFGPDSARCGLRYTHRPQDRGFSLGFRVARDVN